MKNMDMDRKVRQAFEKATPNVLDSVLSDCREQKGTVIMMTEKKNNRWKTFTAIAAALALVIGLGAGFGIYQVNNTVSSTISLDVNPSIEITVNNSEKVLNVQTLNLDGEIVLDDMDLRGSDIDVAVNAIIGSMLRNGYISELANTILVSVDSQDPAEAAALQAKLTENINTLLNTGSFTGAVMSQTVTHEASLEAMARQHNISLGKAQLIQEIVAQDSHYTFDDLSKLDINELKLISESRSIKLDNVSTVGNASDKEYIGREAARDAALSDAGATLKQITALEIEMDYDDGRMIYEVEFDFSGKDYDYDIDASTGSVLWVDKEHDDNRYDDIYDDRPVDPDVMITKDAARDAALKHAGVTADQIRDYSCELDEDDGRYVYEIEFKSGRTEYEYEISARTGEIIKSEKDNDD